MGILARVRAAVGAFANPQRARLATGSYRAAWNPRTRTRAIDGSGDYHLDDLTRERLRSLSRDLERNNHCYDGLLANYVVFLVGSGPRPIWRTRSAEFNAAAAAAFAAAARTTRLDGRGLSPWAPWCAHLARCVVRDGEAGVWHLRDGTGVVIESERIKSCEMNAVGRITGYEVYRAADRYETKALSTERFSLVAHRSRPSQTRGAPVLAASLDDWERLDSLNEAEIISAEAASLPWMVIKQESGTYHDLVGADGAGSRDDANPYARKPGWLRHDAGYLMGLPPGLDGQPWAPDRPNLDVPAFVRMQLRHLCLPLLPYEIAFLDLADLNYAAVRALGKLAKRKLSDARTYWMEPVLSRIAADFAAAEMIENRLPFVDDFAAIEWQWDELDIRDREKDAVAVEREMANGTTSLLDELGPEWRRTVDQRALEAAYTAAAMARARDNQSAAPLPGAGAAISGAPSP